MFHLGSTNNKKDRRGKEEREGGATKIHMKKLYSLTKVHTYLSLSWWIFFVSFPS